jgi:hypothetical protein
MLTGEVRNVTAAAMGTAAALLVLAASCAALLRFFVRRCGGVSSQG